MNKTIKQTIQGRKIVKSLGLLRDIYYNNYGIEAILLDTGEVFVGAKKLGRRIPENNMILPSIEHYKRLFDDETKSDLSVIRSGLVRLDPESSKLDHYEWMRQIEGDTNDQ